MSLEITLAEYFGPYADNPAVTPEIRYKATAMLDVVNDLYAVASQDGCELPDNPDTGSGVSGQGHGGFRAPECTVGAKDSQHRQGRAVDRYDPQRQFASWCLAHLGELEKRGLHMEDPRWTPTWVHLQDVPPHSGKTVYIPNMNPALAQVPKPWEADKRATA